MSQNRANTVQTRDEEHFLVRNRQDILPILQAVASHQVPVRVQVWQGRERRDRPTAREPGPDEVSREPPERVSREPGQTDRQLPVPALEQVPGQVLEPARALGPEQAWPVPE